MIVTISGTQVEAGPQGAELAALIDHMAALNPTDALRLAACAGRAGGGHYRFSARDTPSELSWSFYDEGYWTESLWDAQDEEVGAIWRLDDNRWGWGLGPEAEGVAATKGQAEHELMARILGVNPDQAHATAEARRLLAAASGRYGLDQAAAGHLGHDDLKPHLLALARAEATVTSATTFATTQALWRAAAEVGEVPAADAHPNPGDDSAIDPVWTRWDELGKDTAAAVALAARALMWRHALDPDTYDTLTAPVRAGGVCVHSDDPPIHTSTLFATQRVSAQSNDVIISAFFDPTNAERLWLDEFALIDLDDAATEGARVVVDQPGPGQVAWRETGAARRVVDHTGPCPTITYQGRRLWQVRDLDLHLARLPLPSPMPAPSVGASI